MGLHLQLESWVTVQLDFLLGDQLTGCPLHGKSLELLEFFFVRKTLEHIERPRAEQYFRAVVVLESVGSSLWFIGRCRSRNGQARRGNREARVLIFVLVPSIALLASSDKTAAQQNQQTGNPMPFHLAPLPDAAFHLEGPHHFRVPAISATAATKSRPLPSAAPVPLDEICGTRRPRFRRWPRRSCSPAHRASEPSAHCQFP